MRIRMTLHFRARLAERNIHLGHVRAALRNPDERIDILSGKIKVRKKIDGRILEVVYCKKNFRDRQDEYVLITAYFK